MKTKGIKGAKDQRPAFDQMLRDAATPPPIQPIAVIYTGPQEDREGEHVEHHDGSQTVLRGLRGGKGLGAMQSILHAQC
jgi:hypothetical protein